MRIRPFLAASLLLAACHAERDPSAGEIARLRGSTDRVAIYDAGVAAFRAKDYVRARQLWQRAIALGDREATSNLAFLLYYGWGGPPDSSAARELWRSAMEAGEAEAHRHVAQAILDGDRRLGTLDSAYGHALAAARLARRPHEVDGAAVAADAEALARRLRTGLSSEEQARGERLAASWAQR